MTGCGRTSAPCRSSSGSLDELLALLQVSAPSSDTQDVTGPQQAAAKPAGTALVGTTAAPSPQWAQLKGHPIQYKTKTLEDGSSELQRIIVRHCCSPLLSQTFYVAPLKCVSVTESAVPQAPTASAAPMYPWLKPQALPGAACC